MSDTTRVEDVLSLAKKEGRDFSELAAKYSEGC